MPGDQAEAWQAFHDTASGTIWYARRVTVGQELGTSLHRAVAAEAKKDPVSECYVGQRNPVINSLYEQRTAVRYR